jgi:hypothetical protein
MEWLFDADRRIERQLGFPGVSKEETTTDLLYIRIDLQVHEDGNIIRAERPLSYPTLGEVKDPGFILYVFVQMSIDMCLDHAREKGEVDDEGRSVKTFKLW